MSHTHCVAKKRKLVLLDVDEGPLSCEAVLCPAKWSRLQDYRASTRDVMLDDDIKALFVNLTWSASWGTWCKNVAPTLVRGSHLWGMVQDRELLAEEHFLMHGFPMPGFCDQEHSTTFPYPVSLSKGKCQKASSSASSSSIHLKTGQVKHLVGNGMDVRAVGSQLLWAISALDWQQIVTTEIAAAAALLSAAD